MASCLRPRMFTTKGTARVGHASDITIRRLNRPFTGIVIEIRQRAYPDAKIITTLEDHELDELVEYLQTVQKRRVT